MLRLSESKGNFGDSHVKGYSGSMESSRCMLSRDSDSGSPGVLMLLKYLSLPSFTSTLPLLLFSKPRFSHSTLFFLALRCSLETRALFTSCSFHWT